MANKLEDNVTEEHAHILAHDYNLAPRTAKCERTLKTVNDICTLWLARKDRTVRNLVKYHADQITAHLFVGEPCTACWSEGKLWENETVPRDVFCSLSGFEDPVEFLNTVFEPGEPIKMGVYMLQQKNAPDCTYEYLDDTVEIIWTPGDVQSSILVTTKPDDIVRMDASASGCFKRFKQNSTRAEINYYQP